MENNTFEIYQLKDDRSLRYLRFEGLERIHMEGYEVQPDNYNKVYEAENTQNMGLEDIFEKFNMERPDDFKGHSLSVSDIVVMNVNGESKAYYCDISSFEEVPEFLEAGISELAVKIGDRMVSIQETDGGYDYSIYDMAYNVLDGGVIDNPNISIHKALNGIVEDLKESKYDPVSDVYYRNKTQGNVGIDDKPVRIDYEELTEKSEEVEMEKIRKAQNNIDPVMLFRQKTQECFHPVGDLSIDDIEATAAAIVQSSLDDISFHAKVVDAALIGSRARGIETEHSDINVVVEFTGDIREETIGSEVIDSMMLLGGYRLVIDPISAEQSGSLRDFLPKEEEYLAAKAKQRNIEVTFQVAECSEFPSLGELHENIKTAEEAMQIFKSIPPERLNAIPSISLNFHEKGNEPYMDDQIEVFVRGKIDMETLEYVPDAENHETVIENLAQLMYLNPDAEIYGTVPQKVQDRLDEIKLEHMNPIERLAYDIDDFSMYYDRYEYEDQVDDREENINTIKNNIETGETGYLKEWLSDIVINSDFKDYFSKAKQLLSRLEHTEKILEYKPLAKVEELEEGNYTRIDGLIDTTDKNKKREDEQQHVRVSIKDKLAEKKAEVEKRKKEKECEKGKDKTAPSIGKM